MGGDPAGHGAQASLLRTLLILTLVSGWRGRLLMLAMVTCRFQRISVLRRLFC